ncbi:MAG: MarR family winged helix-turn-helix transcriptional regulator [Cyclobacteriaceae bacterium]
MTAEESIDYAIKTAWHSISRMYNQKAALHNMTTSIGFVLLNISSSEGTPATKIAPLLGLEARSLTRMLRTLEEKNYIYRQRDPNDRRTVYIHLTEMGKEKKGKTIETVKAFNNYMRELIPGDKLKVFFEVAAKITASVENDEKLREAVFKD